MSANRSPLIITNALLLRFGVLAVGGGTVHEWRQEEYGNLPSSQFCCSSKATLKTNFRKF